MGLAGFLRKLQDINTKHKFISTIFFCLLVTPPTSFYSFYASTYLSNVFLTKNSEDFVGATIDYISFIAQVEGFAVLGISLISLLILIVHILASESKIDPEAKLSIKTLILTVTKPARSLIFTWFFVRLFKLGFIFLGMLLLQNQFLVFINSSCDQKQELSSFIASNTGTIIVLAGGVLIFSYLASFGNLAIDISVREGVCGTEALEKASQVLEGKRKIIWFLVNMVLGVISLFLFVDYVYLKTCSKISVDSKKVIMSELWGMGIYQIEFYTWGFSSIFYSMSKKSRGETITFQLHGSFKRIMLEEQPLLST